MELGSQFRGGGGGGRRGVGGGFIISISWMGKIKTKYPLQIELDFMLFLESSDLIRESYSCVLQNGNLEYYHLEEAFKSFLSAGQINYQAYMFFQSVQSDRQELVQTDWNLTLPQIEQHHRYIIVKVKSHTQYMKDLFYEQLQDILTRINKIENKIDQQPQRKEEIQLETKLMMAPPPIVPMLHHASSIGNPIFFDKDLDIGVLFSEPIFDQKKHKEANMPVDFRSELQRMESALNNSYKPEITIDCQIATRQHLKHLIAYKRPKILHIICHGSKEGALQFEDDSKFSIGALCSVSTQKIREILSGRKDIMPQLVFINSCHSQIIGKVFYQAGAKYCIMIDSMDKIDDEAAQIFSQNFYRNIFRGEKVGLAFKEAQDNVKIKHNSSGCCCRHTSRETHKENCRWLQLCQTMGQQQAHRIYHIPSLKCICQLRNINQHEVMCEWAQFSLFHINNDFRIPDQNVKGTPKERFPKSMSQLPSYLPRDGKKRKLLICCCFNFENNGTGNNENHIPHSESNKFKMLPEDSQNSQAIYQLQKNIAFRTQVISMTAPELIQHHQRVQNSSVMGRQQELYFFMKDLQNKQYNTFFLYGHPGVGKTTFGIKAATYLLERQVFHIYYFIDLFGIRDKDMFRNKFNEVTKLDYPFNQSIINEISGKKMMIILDNVDEFFMSNIEEFQEELDTLKKQFGYIKLILTCKQKNITSLENSSFYTDNHCLRRQLLPLDQNTAAKALYSKIRNYLDISISYLDIREMVGSKQELRIPKMIENFSHSFSHTKGKVKLDVLKQKLSQLGQGDIAFNKLIEENLNLLKARCKESYDMLIFISQFSQGIDKNDFSILSSYDRLQNKEGLDSVIIDIPIDRNWKKRLAVLFEQSDLTDNLKVDSEGETMDTLGPTFDRKATQFHPDKLQNTTVSVPDQVFQTDSYFLQQLSRNRFVVRRFIRDFIWNKDKSDQNFYMKHIFVAYTSVMLDIYLSFLVTQKYIHESLIEYTDISQAGIFKYKDNNYFQISLTESIRYVEDYNSRFEKILKQQQSLRQKIKNSDPSVFIFNHKLDFLHIYSYDWIKIYQYLRYTRKKQASVLINYLQRLIILIPTAMKVANLDQSLRKYAIRQSIQLLAQIRKYSKPANNLMLTLKLKLMRASQYIQKNDENILPNTQFQKDFHPTDLQGIDSYILKSIQEQFNLEIEILEIYQEYIKSKQFIKNNQNLHKTAQRIVETIRKIQEWNCHVFRDGTDCQILDSKRKLILALIFHKVVEASGKYPTNTRIQQFKNNHNHTSFVKKALEAADIFSIHHMTKLTLRAKLVALSINWEQLKTRVKQNQFSRELERERTLLRECEELYEDKKNNLIGLTIFDAVLKKIKKEMKDRMWQESANNIVIMRAIPLSNKNTPILENVVRKRQKYRKNLQDIFRHAKIDISVKFQVLTGDRLEQETKRNSNILLLITTFRIQGGKVFIVCQNNDLTELYIEINSNFVDKFKLQNTRLFIIMGPNASEAFKQLEKLFPSSPSLLAVDTGSTAQFDDFDDLNYEGIFDTNSTQELRKTIEHNNKVQNGTIQFGQSFIKSLINPKNYQNINYVLEDLNHSCKDMLQDFKIKKRQYSTEIIRLRQGTFKDLSPGFRKAHNIDLDFQIKNSNIPCVYRKWKEITQLFKQFSSKKETKYIQVCGSNGVGKTTFIQEIGRLCIERGLFQNGVYIIDGKKVGESFQSDFQAYISKMSETSSMFTLQSFNKYADSNFLLIIDDFHTIKPRSNGRYNLFMTKLLQKKASVIFVTHQTYSLRELLPKSKTIKLQKLTDIELNIFAYNLFKPDQEQAIEEYEKQKRHHLLTGAQIANIYEKHLNSSYTNYNNFMKPLDQDHMRKLTSNFM